MKLIKLFLLTFLIFSQPKSIHSQSWSELDKKNGWKIFKLGSDISLFKKDLVKEDVKNVKYELYQFKGKAYTTFFSNEIKSLSLVFYKQKLYQIIIHISGTENIYSTLVNDLNKIFGESPELSDLDSDCTKANQWKGKSVIMQTSLMEVVSFYPY